VKTSNTASNSVEFIITEHGV